MAAHEPLLLSPHTVDAEAGLSIAAQTQVVKEDVSRILAEIDGIRQSQYESIFSFGTYAVAAGLLFLLLGISIHVDSFGEIRAVLGAITFAFVIFPGMVIIACVPVDEYSIDTWAARHSLFASCSKNYCGRSMTRAAVMHVVFILTALGAGAFYATVFPYVIGVLAFMFGAYLAVSFFWRRDEPTVLSPTLSKTTDSASNAFRVPVTTVLYLSFSLALMLTSNQYGDRKFLGPLYAGGFAVSVIRIGFATFWNVIPSWLRPANSKDSDSKDSDALPIKAMSQPRPLCSEIYSCVASSLPEPWRSRLVYDTLFIVCTTVGIGSIAGTWISPGKIEIGSTLLAQAIFSNVFLWLITLLSAAMLVPAVRKRIFRTVVRCLPADKIFQLQKKACIELANLRRKTDNTPPCKGDVYWVLRSTRGLNETEIENVRQDFYRDDKEKNIARRLWMLGIVDSPCKTRIYYKRDIDVTWNARFCGSQLKFTQNSLKPAPTPSFDAWVADNFSSPTPEHSDDGDGLGPYVVFKSDFFEATQDIETWIEDKNFRESKTSELKSACDTLFKDSPRSAAAQNSIRFSKPKQVLEASHRLDYFVSHSWEDILALDVKESKVSAFEKLFQSEYSIWLDKTCLNKTCSKQDTNSNEQNGDSKQKKQADSIQKAMAFAALPVNVVFCERLLVALSPTYLQRLWCIWELGTISLFYVKEIVDERIHLLPKFPRPPLVDDVWRFDDAHCFDPNEELKIRTVMEGLGIERFKAAAERLMKRVRRQQYY